MSTASPIPFAFFGGLEDPHQLGSEKPVVPQERTWLERIAAWKAGRRADLRGFLRRQVSRDYRAQRRATEDRQKVARRQTLQFNTFAQVPLLNPSRLVASWREILPRVRDAESRRIPFDVTGPGIYLVEAVNPPLKAYTIVIVSDVGLVTKTAPGQILVFAAHRTTGTPQRACEIRVLVDRRGLDPVQTGEDGTAFLNVGATKPESVLTLARCGAEVTISDPGNWALQAPARELVGYVYTDKPIYRPGQTVRVKGVLRWRTRDRLELFDGQRGRSRHRRRERQSAGAGTRPVDAFGTVNTSFTVPAGAALGHYVDHRRVGRRARERQLRGPGVPQAGVRRHGHVAGSVRAAGRPRAGHADGPLLLRTAGGQRVGEVRRAPAAVLLAAPVGRRGRRGGGWWGGGDQASEATVRLDAQGRATVTIPLAVDADGRDYSARIEARVTDASNREVSGSAIVHATYGRFMVTTQVDRYVQAPGATAQVGIRAVDYQGAPQSNAALQAFLERLTYPEGRWSDPEGQRGGHRPVTTDADGLASWSASLPASAGWYRFRVTGLSEGRQVEDVSGIWVSGESSEFSQGDAFLELIADKPSYTPGDTARLVIRGAAVTAPVLVTKEGRQISYYRVSTASGDNALEVPVSDEDLGDTYVNIAYVKDDRLYRAEKRLKVPATAAAAPGLGRGRRRRWPEPRQPGVLRAHRDRRRRRARPGAAELSASSTRPSTA